MALPEPRSEITQRLSQGANNSTRGPIEMKSRNLMNVDRDNSVGRARNHVSVRSRYAHSNANINFSCRDDIHLQGHRHLQGYSDTEDNV